MVAYKDQRQEGWNHVVEPWLKQQGVKLKPIKDMKVNYASAGRSIGDEKGNGDRAAPVRDPVEAWSRLFNGPPEEGEPPLEDEAP